jgi:hypothetical protein
MFLFLLKHLFNSSKDLSYRQNEMYLLEISYVDDNLMLQVKMRIIRGLYLHENNANSKDYPILMFNPT